MEKEKDSQLTAGQCLPAPICSPMFRPFSNSFEFMVWYDRNCDNCTKGPDADLRGPNERCEIENALALAGCCGGTINDPCIGDESNARALAARLNWDGSGQLPVRCPEFTSENT
jgi:hypothetical protein